MAINLTDALNAATTKGKLADAKQIYLEGDNKNLQDAHKDNEDHLSTLDTRSTQIEEALKTIAATGGASNANAVIYDNNDSGLTAINVKGALDELAMRSTFAGIATPTTNPGTPTQNIFYIAGEGSYPNFNNQVVEVGQIAVLKWDGSWHKEVLEIGAGGGNMILDWNTDVATTRKQVLEKYRKPGIQISYNDPNRGWINEQYVYNETSDVFWVRDENWDTIVNTTYMAEAMYIPLKWNIDVRQTRIQIPIKLRKKGIKLYYKKQLPTIVYMSVGGYPQVNKGGSFNVEIDNKITKIQTQTSDNTETKIAELIASTVVSENWDITNSGSRVIFTSKEIGNRTDYPFAYGNMDGGYFNFATTIQQFGCNDYVYEEYIGTATDNNTFGNISTNWIELSAKEESIIYETPYKYNPLLTRMYIPRNFRKNGKVIRYTDKNGKVSEETYIGSGTENIDWCNSINWKRSNGKIGYIGNCDHLFSFTKTDWWETSDYQTYTPIELPTEIGTALSTDYLEIDKLGSRVLLFNSNYYQLDLIIFDEEKKIIPTKMNIGGNTFVKMLSCIFLPLNAKYVRVRRNIGFLEETERNKQYQLKTFYEGDDTLLGQHDIDLNKLGYCRDRKMLPNGTPENIINSGILTVSTNLFPINNKLKYLIYGVLPNSSNNTPVLCFYDKQYKCIETIIIPYTTINTTTTSMYGCVTPPNNAAYGIVSWHDIHGRDGGTIIRVIGQTEILNEYLSILYNTKIQIAETLDYKSLGDSISAESGSYTRTVAEKLHSRSVEHCAVGGAGFAFNKNGIYWIGKQLDKIPQGYEGIITLMGGINDWGGKVPLGSTEEAIRKTMDECYNSNTLMDNFRWVLETMINKCSWKARIFILTQLERYPIVEAGYTVEDMRVETEKLAAHYLLPIIDVGRKCGLRNGDNLEEDWRRVDGNVKVHPTLDGHNIIGSYVAAKIISMLNGGIKVYKKDE